MLLTPTLGLLRQGDPWVLLARQSSQIGELQIQRKNYVGSKRRRYVLLPLPFSCMHTYMLIHRHTHTHKIKK